MRRQQVLLSCSTLMACCCCSAFGDASLPMLKCILESCVQCSACAAFSAKGPERRHHFLGDVMNNARRVPIKFDQ